MKYAKHGQSGTRTYWVWHNMVMRCHNPRVKSYPDYGGRGISVCDRWRTFDNFYADMGTAPEGMEIDRVDNDGNYEPANCQWTTKLANRQKKRNARLITAFGKTLSTSEWARQTGLNLTTIHMRLQRGWSGERSVSSCA